MSREFGQPYYRPDGAPSDPQMLQIPNASNAYPGQAPGQAAEGAHGVGWAYPGMQASHPPATRQVEDQQPMTPHVAQMQPPKPKFMSQDSISNSSQQIDLSPQSIQANAPRRLDKRPHPGKIEVPRHDFAQSLMSSRNSSQDSSQRSLSGVPSHVWTQNGSPLSPNPLQMPNNFVDHSQMLQDHLKSGPTSQAGTPRVNQTVPIGHQFPGYPPGQRQFSETPGDVPAHQGFPGGNPGGHSYPVSLGRYTPQSHQADAMPLASENKPGLHQGQGARGSVSYEPVRQPGGPNHPIPYGRPPAPSHPPTNNSRRTSVDFRQMSLSGHMSQSWQRNSGGAGVPPEAHEGLTRNTSDVPPGSGAGGFNGYTGQLFETQPQPPGHLDPQVALAHAQALRRRQLARTNQLTSQKPGPAQYQTGSQENFDYNNTGPVPIPQPPYRRQSNRAVVKEATRVSLVALMAFHTAADGREVKIESLVSGVDEIPAGERGGVLLKAFERLPENVKSAPEFPLREMPSELFSFMLAKFFAFQSSEAVEPAYIDGQHINLYSLFFAVQSEKGFVVCSKRLKWLRIAKQFKLRVSTKSCLELLKVYIARLLPLELIHLTSPNFRQRLQAVNAVVRAYMRRSIDAPPGRRHADMLSAIRTLRVRARVQAQARDKGQPLPSLLPPQLMPNGRGLQSSGTSLPEPATGAGSHARTRIARAMRDMGLQRYRRLGGDPVRDRDKLFHVLSQDSKYLLQRKRNLSHGGRNLRSIVPLSSELDNWRPELAFPLDLGMVDLHAITLSLGSRETADVRQALDKLIVVTTDPHVHIALQHSPRLLANVCDVAYHILQHLLDDELRYVPDQGKPKHDVVEYEPWTLSDHILEELKAKSGDFDISIEVSSETGAEIETVEPMITDLTESIRSAEKKQAAKVSDNQQSLRDLLDAPRFALQSAVRASADKGTWDNPPPFNFMNYSERYAKIEEEMQELKRPLEERKATGIAASCNRLLAATCVLRNLSFAEPNRPLMARKNELISLLWSFLYALAEKPLLLDSHLRTLDLCKDLLVVLSNISIHMLLTDHTNTLVLIMFLLSFSTSDDPFVENDRLEFHESDLEIHRLTVHSIDIFSKLASRSSNREIIENVMRDTVTDPLYRRLIRRHLGKRTSLRPCEFLSRTFALVVSVMPSSQLRPPTRDIESRRPFLMIATNAAEILASMLPMDGDQPENAPTPWKGVNLAAQWLASADHFGNRMLRTISFMAVIIISQGNGLPHHDKMRPFEAIVQRALAVAQILYRKAREHSSVELMGMFPTVEHLIGCLMSGDMDKNAVRQLSTFYDASLELAKVSGRHA